MLQVDSLFTKIGMQNVEFVVFHQEVINMQLHSKLHLKQYFSYILQQLTMFST